MDTIREMHWERYPAVGAYPEAQTWLATQVLLGRAPNTIAAYGRSLHEYLTFCAHHDRNPETATRGDIAAWVHDLAQRPPRHRSGNISHDCDAGLANATVQLRLVAVRLFYDYLIEEGCRATNPVGRGRYTPGQSGTRHTTRGIVPHLSQLPWIPTDEQWHTLVAASRVEPIRNRFMLALAYDAGLRREELCALRTDDIDPAYRTIRVRAETTKTRRERVVPYSASTGILFRDYLTQRRQLSGARGALFLSESRRNRAAPLTMWTWSKVVRGIAQRAGVSRFSTHTLRHLCLTDLARAGWDLHAIAQFAGHRNPATTMQYIHLSGRDLAAALARGMAQIHRWRVAQIAGAEEDADGDHTTL